jgi:hypothetical protein
LLARIGQPEAPVDSVGVKIRLVRDQQRAGTVVDVRVVGDVDEHVLRNRAILNPRMKHRHKLVCVPSFESSSA